MNWLDSEFVFRIYVRPSWGLGPCSGCNDVCSTCTCCGSLLLRCELKIVYQDHLTWIKIHRSTRCEYPARIWTLKKATHCGVWMSWFHVGIGKKAHTADFGTQVGHFDFWKKSHHKMRDWPKSMNQHLNSFITPSYLLFPNACTHIIPTPPTFPQKQNANATTSTKAIMVST